VIDDMSSPSAERSGPDTPVPDAKDWTWVLDRRCEFCAFDGRLVAGTEVSAAVSGLVPRWLRVTARDDVAVRPAPAVWSPLEYACHVRDVFAVFGDRATLMLAEEGPRFADWDQDRAAIAGRYWEQDPQRVAEELAANGRRLSAVFAAVPEGSWERRGRRSNGSLFTVDSLGRYLLHDVVHHLADVSG
jgi:DinB superfamily